jgi:glucosamine--fructose-6-phosphate aminotransferase (isomerizing)
MPIDDIAVVLLAAGKGTRMKSDIPKVLHPLAGQPLVKHALAAADALGAARCVVVVGPGMEDVEHAVAPRSTVVQDRQQGTADAVLAARDALAGFGDESDESTILVLYADTPLIRPGTLSRMIEARKAGAAAVVLGFRPDDPGAYGRLLLDDEGGLQAIVEYRDADEAQRAVTLCNSGVMAVSAASLWGLLDRVGNDNAKGEYYLTDIVALARADGLACAVVEGDAAEMLGINSRNDLAAAEAVWQQARRAAAMADGATLLDPATVWFSHDTGIGRDVVIGPSVFFGPGVTVADGAEVRAFCHLEGAEIGPGAVVGPFARLRPGAVIRRGQERGAGRGRQGQPSQLCRRRLGRGRGEYWRRHHHLQLRRLPQAPHPYRQGRFHRLQHRAGGTGERGRRRDRRRRQYDHQGRARRRHRRGAWPAEDASGRGGRLPRRQDQGKESEKIMCGIIGIIGNGPAAPLLLDGLKRLEYRGYDSAGIATLTDGRIERRRAEGKLTNLQARLDAEPLGGLIGIGHTRWATHGVPNETNAHPHATARVAVVHNGIIENFQELRAELADANFESETDTEVVVHLLTRYMDDGLEPVDAVAKALPRLEGAFGMAIVFAGEENLMIGARRGSPLAIGYGDGEMYFGSDAMALAPLTRRICYLEEGDWAVATREGAMVFDADNKPVERPVVETALSGAMIGKGNYRHFMLKEIYEQPAVIGDTLHSMLNPADRTITLPPLTIDLAAVPKITIIACGTAFYAGMVAKYWLEQIARMPVEIDIASEFRYREAPMPEGGLALFISQSGETADTLAALRYAKAQDQTVLSVVNVPESTIARESDAVLPTLAGPEIGVASTKAFTTQLTALACLAVTTARARKAIDAGREAELSAALTEVPGRAAEVLSHDERIEALAHGLVEARDVIYLGRGSAYPLALEGALKLKEISYIHAEGYAAGEMKHGPIALIDEAVPVIVIAPGDPLFDKTASNLQEVIARGGRVIVLSDADGVAKIEAQAKPEASIALPAVDPFVAPILYAIPVQLLAYHTAVLKGTDVDQPRNLAKSVTVE